MHKTLMWGAAAVVLGSGAASAAPEVPVFDGIATLTAVNNVCTDDGWGVGNQFGFIFRSAVRPSNDRGGGLQLMSERYGYTFFMPEGKALQGGSRKGTFSGAGLSSQVGAFTFSSPFKLEITPSKITDSTEVVTVKGTLGNFGGTEGCTVTIFAVASPRL